MKDLILGLVLLTLSIVVLVLSSSFPNFIIRGERLPGPKFFPTVLAIILICFALYCIVVGFMRSFKKSQKSSEHANEAGIVNVLCIVLSVIFFVPIINFFGTIVGIILLGTVLMILLSIKWYQSLIYSSVLAFLVYVIFQVLFKVPLAEGILFSFFVR